MLALRQKNQKKRASRMNSLIEQFNTLTTRERSILLATLAIVFWGAWDNFFYQPLIANHSQLKDQLSSINLQVMEQQQSAMLIEALGKTDPNQTNKQKLSQIKIELKKLKSQLGIGEKVFVSAHVMVEVLSNILKKNSALKLVKLESIPVTSLSKSDQDHSGVYRHGLSITLRGNYQNTLNYLKSLESLPWKFSWDTIDYKVDKYPIAETTLRVYTLSFEENWLGL